MKRLLVFPLVLIFVACSGSKPAKESMDAGIELADAVEFTEETQDVVGDSLAEDPMAPLADAAPAEVAPLMESPMPSIDEMAVYEVKENETLMMVAFNLYGDYARWKEIAELNKDKLNGSTLISKGMKLDYKAPAEPFIFNPSGNPYLIVKGDTLGVVSEKTYGKPVHWKEIWENNRPLIKDPNVIFAGFTIYTPFLEGRDVAFDKQ